MFRLQKMGGERDYLRGIVHLLVEINQGANHDRGLFLPNRSSVQKNTSPRLFGSRRSAHARVVLAHRLLLTPSARLKGVTPKALLEGILESTMAPGNI